MMIVSCRDYDDASSSAVRSKTHLHRAFCISEIRQSVIKLAAATAHDHNLISKV